MIRSKTYYTTFYTALLLTGSAKVSHSFLPPPPLPSSRPRSSSPPVPRIHASKSKDVAAFGDDFVSSSANLYSNNNEIHDNELENLFVQQERRIFLQSASSAFLAITASCSSFPTESVADEPSNLYYRSQADDEDPLVTFGKSLQSAGGTFQSSSDDSKGENEIKYSQSANNIGGDAAPSMLDIALPSPSSSSASAPLSLDEAIKVESQKRRIDPRTHG
ncbi:hypothetical protein ACHAXS_011680 [Conticribra weissflogii]